MRSLALIFVTAICSNAHGEPLPEIKVGPSGRMIEISMTPWYSGFVATSEAFLAGTVMEASSEVETTPRQTWLSESCVMRVERAFGRVKGLEGISTARLSAGYDRSPYTPVDPNWGRLRHLQKGRRILVLLHEHEGMPCFGSEALIEFSREIQDLPRILRRTGFDPARFTDADLAVVRLASPLFHDQLAAEAEIRREMSEDDAAWLNRLVLGIVAGFLALLLAVQGMAQKPIT
ncbi:MAG: hypothetical protein JNM65_08340 [Verrucomicrobiaceae bacterium]|nr:hypothetical protein [Verrucomicrobiaceae bacterium]